MIWSRRPFVKLLLLLTSSDHILFTLDLLIFMNLYLITHEMLDHSLETNILLRGTSTVANISLCCLYPLSAELEYGQKLFLVYRQTSINIVCTLEKFPCLVVFTKITFKCLFWIHSLGLKSSHDSLYYRKWKLSTVTKREDFPDHLNGLGNHF